MGLVLKVVSASNAANANNNGNANNNTASNANYVAAINPDDMAHKSLNGSEDKENQTIGFKSRKSGGVTRLDTSNGAISTPPFFLRII